MYLKNILSWYADQGNKLDNLSHVDVLNNDEFKVIRLFFKEDGSTEIHPLCNIDVPGTITDQSYTQVQITEAIKSLG